MLVVQYIGVARKKDARILQYGLLNRVALPLQFHESSCLRVSFRFLHGLWLAFKRLAT
mgnify:CR=1 FL=1